MSVFPKKVLFTPPSMVDKLVFYAREHKCTAREAANALWMQLRVKSSLEEVAAANRILHQETEGKRLTRIHDRRWVD